MADDRAANVGIRVAVALGALTIVEYVMAIAEVPGLLFLLVAMALAKAWLIVVHFMHIRQLRGGEQ